LHLDKIDGIKITSSGLNAFPDFFLIKLIEFAEFIDSDEIITAFVVRYSDFSGQALCSTTRHAGDILDIPVLKYHTSRYIV
jgi:hypothetical protein